tara:strand:- start:1054 stop:1446 length:393 start_codon:yes stop_codon:yes gene_type:complete
MDELKGIQISSRLSRAFFSPENISNIQDNIRYNVWINTNKEYIIGNQNEYELKIIMRSVYLQNALNQEDNITTQILNLNNLVLNYCVKQVTSQVIQYINYQKEINSDRYIMDHSINTNSRGEKSLEMKFW